MPDTVGLEQHEQTSLWGIARKAKANPQHRFRDLYRLLNEGLLKIAWHRLNKQSAIADDDITVKQYASNLDANLRDLAARLKAKRYRTKLIRRRYIDKENGKKRPLGIPALEDKLVQKAAALILEDIYEQDFLDCSYGYRVERGAKDAVSDLTFQLQYGVYGYIVEADIKGFFDHIDHQKLLEMMKRRIDDQAFLCLIGKWLKAGILEPEGHIIHPDTGTPQGGIVSPILANIYLHTVLDEWFMETVKPNLKGRAIICRYADDWVCAFQYRDDAERFYRVQPKRLGKYALEVEPSKTRIIRFSRFHPSRKRMISFLGFEYYWWKDRSGTARVMRRTARSRQLRCLRGITEWIKTKRHLPKRKYFAALKRKLVGHYNYYYVRGNSRSVWSFYSQAIELLYKWLNRRSQRKSYTWKQLNQLIKYVGLPRPRLMEKKRRHQVALG
jgi:group II intron reverse transcriptase/maturase